MKVLILSAPRCYTKNLQDLVSSALSANQLKLYSAGCRTPGHLHELLNFNECTVLGIDEKGVVQTQMNDPKLVQVLTLYRPRIRADGHFMLIRCEEPGWGNYDRFMEILDHLESTNRDFVVKLFPHKLQEMMEMTDDQVTTVYERLGLIFDVILPVMRMDNDARIRSSVMSSVNGWDSRAGVRKLDAPTIPPRTYALWSRREAVLRDCLNRMNLRPIWSEDLARNAKEILKTYGIEVQSDLPQEIEYTKGDSLMLNRVMILGNSTIGRAVRQEYQQRGTMAVIAGRSGECEVHFDLLDRSTWDNVLNASWHEMHFTLHTRGMQTDFIEASHQFFEKAMTKKARIIFYSHQLASMHQAVRARTASDKDSWFRIVRAAMNMAVVTSWIRETAKADLLLVDPGSFQSPINPTATARAEDRVGKLVDFCLNWDGVFKYVNTDTGEEIPL